MVGGSGFLAASDKDTISEAIGRLQTDRGYALRRGRAAIAEFEARISDARAGLPS